MMEKKGKGSNHLIFMGGGGGYEIYRKKNPGPNFPEKKISRTGKVLLHALYYLQIKIQDRVADEKNIQARKHLPVPPPQ